MDDGGGVCVSAPGKVLITGGYLVLDEQYSGLVLASTARFYTRICAAQVSFHMMESSLQPASSAVHDELTPSLPPSWTIAVA